MKICPVESEIICVDGVPLKITEIKTAARQIARLADKPEGLNNCINGAFLFKKTPNTLHLLYTSR